METVVYPAGTQGEPIDVYWSDEDGELVDFSSGYTFSMTVGVFGETVAFTKTNLMVGAAGDLESDPPVPNLVVSWPTTGQIVGLSAGKYVMHLTATPSSGLPLNLYGDLVIRLDAPNNGYCEATDLLIGDVPLSATLNRYDWINSAADEMHAKLGQMYQLPLDLDDAEDFVRPMLKKINQFLATGRLIAAQAMSSDGDNKYAQSLIDEAKSELCALSEGRPPLVGVPRILTDFKATAPAIINGDAESALDAYEGFTGRYESAATWAPGQ